jgi:hypothetical protein
VMRKRNPVITQAVAAFVELAKCTTRGEIIPYSDIEKATGLVRDSSAWKVFIRKIKGMTIDEMGVTIWVQPSKKIGLPANFGVKLLTTDETFNFAGTHRRNKSLVQINKGKKETGSVPRHEMNDRQREEQDRQSEQWDRERRVNLQSARIMRAVFTPVLSPRPRSETT